MSYHLRDDAGLEGLLDYSNDAIAGLEALPGLGHLAQPWRDLRAGLRKARDDRDDDRWAASAAGRKVAVYDAQWDRALTDLSGRAFLAAGKKADLDPYVSLFGAIAADEAIRLGVHKASAFGTQVVQKAKALAFSDLTASVATLEAATDTLEAGGAVRDELALKAQLHDIARRQQLLAAEKLIAATEVGILTAFPGRSDLVRAALAPQRPERQKAPELQGPAPQVAAPVPEGTPAA